MVVPVKPLTPLALLEQERSLPPDPIPPKPPEPYKPEETAIFEKPAFIQPAKPIAKISPSSIPNPNPSVMTPKQVDSGYPNFGSYLYNIPGYSAFQPINSVNHQPPMPPPSIPPPSSIQNEGLNPDFIPFPPMPKENLPPPMVEEHHLQEQKTEIEPPKEIIKPQTDFEEQFTPEIITATSVSEPSTTQSTESKLSITSLTQGSGATITIPAQIINKEFKKKPERFSLKTSIPISKIDMKCVSNPPDFTFQSSLAKKTYGKESRVEIQSNIIIKSATIEPEVKEAKPSETSSSNISTLISATDAMNITDNTFRVPESKTDSPTEAKDSSTLPKLLFNTINIETSKQGTFKPPELSYTDTKKKIVYIQSKKKTPNSKVTFIQQNPQVLLQRTSFEPKNPQPPLRQNQSKKCKEDVVNEGTSSKVVALKRLHQENSDENDFENLITENQIYGNKIVVKEKSQGTSQEQDLKSKQVPEKVTTTETKNVVLQPCNNFVYLSNVQIPANFMMIKNNAKIGHTPEAFKAKIAPIVSSRVAPEIITVPGTVPITESNTEVITSIPNTPMSEESHVLSNNRVIPTLPNITQPDIVIQANPIKPDLVIQTNPMITQPDIVIQANPTVIVSPKILYQVPISSIMEPDKLKPPLKKRDLVQFVPPLLQKIAPKTDAPKKIDPPITNDKLFFACPYQMDATLQPQIVITNILPNFNIIDEESSLDNYEKRQRLRRLKHLSKPKDVKQDAKKVDKTEIRNIITPDKVKNEIYKEFANTKVVMDGDSSDSDTDDYGEEDMRMYEDIIEEYGDKDDNKKGKVDFMAGLRLATLEAYKGMLIVGTTHSTHTYNQYKYLGTFDYATRLCQIMPNGPAVV